MTSIVARMCAPNIMTKQALLRPLQSLCQGRKCSTEAKAESATPSGEERLINPLMHPDFFQVHNLFTIKDLFNAKVHLGHKAGTLHDDMKQFVYGSRLGHMIIDLDKTAEYLRAALNFTAHIAFRDGIILFVARNAQFTHLVEKTALECKEFAYTREWKDNLFPDSTKAYGLVTRLPDLCIFLNTMDTVLRPHRGVTHAAKMCIPTIGIVDTNCTTSLVTYPVPGNDDSSTAINLYCKLFKDAIMRGKQARQKLQSVQ